MRNYLSSMCNPMEAILAGAAYLDEIALDHEWRTKIDLNKLLLFSGQWCVLGQLERKKIIAIHVPDDLNARQQQAVTVDAEFHDAYTRAVYKLGIGFSQAERLGFRDGAFSSNQLQAAWEKYLREYQKG